MKTVEVLATILTIAGFFMLSEGMPLGFAISLMSNVLWLCWGYDAKAWGILVVNSCLALSAVNGILNGV